METTHKKLTLSNALTVSRLFMLPFIVYLLVRRQNVAAFMIMSFSLLTDVVDGFLARRFHQESELGKLLDPLCDKISLAVILTTLVSLRELPLWIAIVVVMRDILILLGSFFVYSNRAYVFKSNFLGKITGFLFGALILAYTIRLRGIGIWTMYTAIAFMTATFLSYIYRYITIMKGDE
jgi:CDP-diacylglycerol--glycerol-3-phosphate 3-phosphatidyltransferase